MIETLFWFVIEINFKATVILSLGFVLTLCLVRFQSSQRYLLWKLIFALLAVLPVLVVIGPSVILNNISKPSFSALLKNPESVAQSFYAPGPTAAQQNLLADNKGERSELVAAAQQSQSTVSMNWLLLPSALYLLISVLLLLRLGIQFYRCQKEIACFKPFSGPSILKKILSLKAELGINTDISIRTNNRVETPFVWGVSRMTLVLPETFSQWTLLTQESTLMHELLHIKMRDTRWGLLVKICTCLYWPTILIWKANALVSVEAEKACDEGVLRQTGDEEGYADQLVKIAQYLHPASTPISDLASTVSKPSTLRQRIDNILTNRNILIMKPLNRYLTMLAISGLSLFVVAIDATSQVDLAKGFDQSNRLASYAVLQRVEPVYPSKAAVEKIEGFVVVEFDISTVGTVINPKIIKSQPQGLFDKSSLRAVQQWLYLPDFENGKAKETQGVRTKFTYRLGANTQIESLDFDRASLDQPGPRSVHQANQLINFYVTSNEPADAIKLLGSFLSDNSNNNSQALALLEGVSFQRFAKDKQQKVKLSRQLDQLSEKAAASNSGEIYAALAKIYQELQNWPAAQLALAKAFEKGQLSNPSATKLTLAIVLYNTQHYDGALKVIDSLIANYGETEIRLRWRDIIDASLHRQNLIADHLVNAAIQ